MGTGVGLEAPDVAVAAPHPTTATTAPTDNRERINFIVGSILLTLSLAVGREPWVSMRVEHRKYELVTKFLAAGSARLGQSAPNPSPASARLAQNKPNRGRGLLGRRALVGRARFELAVSSWVLARSVWSRGRVVSRTAQRFEKLVADGTADDELVVRMALARRGVDDPLRAMHEAKMLPQVLAELSEVAEWYAMPETARTPALEQSIAHYARDCVVGRSVVGELQPGGLYDSEALESPRLPALRVRLNPRIRPGVDQSPTGCENPVHLDQGIDHALCS